MKQEIFRDLVIGDTVTIRQDLSEAMDIIPDMIKYAGCSSKIVNRGASTGSLKLEIDHGYYWWNESMLEDIVITPPDIPLDVEEATIRFRAGEYSGLRLCKITNNFDKLREVENSPKFIRVIRGKYVLCSSQGSRVSDKLNPHLKTATEQYSCSNYYVDGLLSVAEEITTFNFENRFYQMYVNFKTGELREVPLDVDDEHRCSMCGDVLNEHSIGRLCERCIDDLDLNKFYSYHDYGDGYCIYEDVNARKTPVFGCEIERDFPDYNDEDRSNAIADILRIMQDDQFRKGDYRRENVFMHDGSLHSGGLEWITFPHTMQWYLANKDKFNKVIKHLKDKYNYTANAKTGNHIHINRSYFYKDDIEDDGDFAGAKMACFIHKYWDEFCDIAQRTNTDYTNKPSVTEKDSIFQVVKKTLRDKDDHSVAVNLQHEDTIEIRIWSGIRDADDLILYIDMTQALARLVKTRSLEKVQSAPFETLLKYIKIPKSLDMIYNRVHGTTKEIVKEFISKKESK